MVCIFCARNFYACLASILIIPDTKVKVSEIIDFGQKISNDWLEAETQKKVQVKQQKQQNKNQDQETEDEEQPPVVQNPRSYNYY